MRRSAIALEARHSLFRKAIELCRPSGAQLVFLRFTQGLRPGLLSSRLLRWELWSQGGMDRLESMYTADSNFTLNPTRGHDDTHMAIVVLQFADCRCFRPGQDRTGAAS